VIDRYAPPLEDALVVKRDVPESRLRAALDEPWFHSFSFSNGLTIAGRDPSQQKLAALKLPDLRGATVLDIGAYEGYFSFQCERLGAARVVAADSLVWQWEGSDALKHFRLVHEMLDSSVQERIVPVEELHPEVGIFDVALFLGVLYHAPDMVGYLRRLRSVTGHVAVVETLVDNWDIDRPSAAYYARGTVNNDGSNWWGPNRPCVEDMLYRVGFNNVRFIGLWDSNTVAGLRGESTGGPVTSGRAVWHAYV
jgi:tRNA (mo5U34)-methyltransferase